MIRDYIKKQLQECNFADLSNYDQKTNTFIIPKYSKPIYELNKCYLVKVATYFINNTSTVIASNWNNNTAPKTPYLKIYVSKKMGKMIYADCLSYDFETQSDLSFMWSGWLSVDDLTQIDVINF